MACIRLLLLAGASLDAYDAGGQAAPEVGDTGCQQAMLALNERKQLVRQAGHWAGRPPLHRAAALGQVGVLRALLRQPGADPDATWDGSAGRRSPAASEPSDEASADEAAASGADECSTAERRAPAPRYPRAAPVPAAQLGREACLKALLAAGASPHVADEAGRPALYLTAQRGDWHCLRALLAADGACDVACEGGSTLLHAAAEAGTHDAIGRVPGSPDIYLRKLPEHVVKPNTPLCSFLSIAGQEHCVLTLLEAGAPLQARDSEGRTALQVAAAAGQEHCVLTLLAEGESVGPGDAADELIAAAMQTLGLAPEGSAAPPLPLQPPPPPASSGSALDETLAAEVLCPITHEVVSSPVVAAGSSTCERAAIGGERVLAWFRLLCRCPGALLC